MDECYIKRGTKVRLLNGGPVMTLRRAFSESGQELDRGPHYFDVGEVYEFECVWFDKSDRFNSARFPSELLEVCEGAD